MKFIKISLTALILCSILAFSAGCGEKAEEEIQEEVIAEIQRGDLSLDVSAVGNLALSETDVLNFELAGTVTDVLANEGDSVKEGQVLAKLDISEREDYIKSLTRTIQLKDQALLQAEINYQNAEEALAAINSQSYVDQKTLQAELNITNAEIALANAQDAYDTAKAQYETNWTVPEYIRTYEQKTTQLSIAEMNLEEAEETLAGIGDDIALEREIKEKELVIVESKLEDAQKEYDEAVADLEEAQVQSWEITAPYDGYITKVNITIGQEVQKSTSAMVIANPDEFEAAVSVSEMDISNISIGSIATVQIDAQQSMILPAEVTKIAPTASIQSGVVNYSVIVKIRATDMIAMDLSQSMDDAFKEAAEAIESGELPAGLQKMVDEGMLTEEQAETMVENMQSGNFPQRSGDSGSLPSFGDDEIDLPPPSFGESEGIMVTPDSGNISGNGFFGDGFPPSVTTIGSDFQLREGLTVTVSIMTESRTDVLLVPSGAVITSGGQSFVTILNADETREQRQIETGLSDWQNTEVLSGLSEGEQVVYTPVIDSSQYPDFGNVYFGPGGGVTVREVRP